jgi:diguanylate cyclase (GGDEF)-like protein
MAAVGLLIAADTISAGLSLLTATPPTLDVLWLSSYVMWGAAALHPSMVTLSSAVPDARTAFTVRRLVALTAATFVAPAILAVQAAIGNRIDVWPVVVGSVLLFSLVVARMAVAIHDIVVAQRERDSLQDHLVYQAAHDALTGLPNRAQGLSQIAGALSRAQRSGAMTALLFIDLDGFKAVNDRFGHAAGDEVLCGTARRMQAAVRGGDLVARLGGDEFIVLLEPVDDEIDAVQAAYRLVTCVSEPITLSDGPVVVVGASIGVALSRHARTNPEDLLSEADAAVYRAKASGKGRVEVFGDTLRQEVNARALLDAQLRSAIDNDDLVVHYQPVVEIGTGRLHGFEALIRWQHPDGRLLNPIEFIPEAERSDLICDVDAWVLEHAVRQLDEWGHRYPEHPITMSVNVSGRHIGQPRVVSDVTRVLAGHSVDPAQLILEITESTVIDDLTGVFHLQQLRQLGVKVAIDDFGAGYNSLTRLRKLAVDVLKIDRAFLEDDDPAGRAIVRLLIQTADAMGLPVVAEGIESAEHLALLRGTACDYGQGYFIARPVAAAQAVEFVRRGRVFTSAENPAGA